MLEQAAKSLPEAAFLGVLAYVFGALLKLSDLLQEHGYRWFRGAAVSVGGIAMVPLLVLLDLADAPHRVFWLAVMLHWILRGRIDGLNHGIPVVAALVLLLGGEPSLIRAYPVPFVGFFVPLTVLGIAHDSYQYEEGLPGPAWVKKFFENQHLYWYAVVLGHVLFLPFHLRLAVAGIAFVKGYGLFYSPRALAVLHRMGISPSS